MADILALFFTNLSKLICISGAFGVVQHIKTYVATSALCLRHNAVFLFAACFDAYIMLRHAFQHIDAFAYVHDFSVNLNAVNTCVFVLWRKALSLQPCIHIVRVIILPHQNLKATFWDCAG